VLREPARRQTVFGLSDRCHGDPQCTRRAASRERM
jgi:hypothetical protein